MNYLDILHAVEKTKQYLVIIGMLLPSIGTLVYCSLKTILL